MKGFASAGRILPLKGVCALRESLTYRFLVILVAGTLLVLVAGLAWEVREQRRQAVEEALAKSRVIARQLLATRAVIAANQDRINRDARGNFEFKHLNPAAVVQQTSHLFNESTRYRIKQTRENARLPENSPDAFELEALRTFAARPELQEYWAESELDGQPTFRYVLPLYMEKDCLPCHGEPRGEADVSGYPREGYRLGELAGAISISVPMQDLLVNVRQNTLRRLLLILVLLAVTVGSLSLLMYRLVQRPLRQLGDLARRIGRGELTVTAGAVEARGEMRELAEAFNGMAARLRELYGNLEAMVESRTAELTLANSRLVQQREELERVNRELAAASRAKSDFLAHMSHELKTPLTSVLAFTEMILGGAAGETTPLQREYLRDIAESGQELLGRINAILDYSRGEAGKLELHRASLAVEELMEAVSRTIRPLAVQKGLDYHQEAEGVLPDIQADRERLEQVLLNLLANAVKFTPAGGRVWLKAREEESGLLLEVGDTGIGIRPEDQEVIFERFRQAINAPGRPYGGSGLGLALARQLVELHGGRVWVESTPGRGSRFFVWLPAGMAEGV